MSEIATGREWHFYLDAMIGFCERVLAFTSELDQTQLREFKIKVVS